MAVAGQNLLMTDPPLWVGGTAVYPYSGELAQRYTIMSKFGDVVKLWEGAQNGELIKLPRGFCPPPTPETDKRAWQDRAPLTSVKITPKSEEQAEGIKDMITLALQGKSFCVKAPTGSGKTVMAIAALAAIGVQTLIVVPKEDLFDQWLKELEKFGVPKAQIGMVRQDKYAVAGKRVVVAMLHSLAIPGKYPEWFKKWPGLTIYDEVHRLPTDTFTAVAAMFSSRVRIGLSATHQRADGLDLIVRGHIGPILVEIKMEQMIPKVLVYRTNWMCPRSMKTDPVTGQKSLQRWPHSPGKTTGIVVRMCKDTARNQLLAEATFAALEKGRKVVFFSEIIEHLEVMQGIFRGLGVHQKDMAYYIGGLKKEERDEAAKKSLLLATWAMMKEGTDIPTLDTAVLGTPRSDVNQAVGRIRRECTTKKFPAVLDFRDDDSPVFKGYADSRQRWYASLGAEVVRMN